LPFLAGRSLGEVCHIVQLAVSQRQVLGYLDGHVVPYYQSEAVVKQNSAVLQQPAWSLKKDTMVVADLTQARECLREILATSSEVGVVPLPNVKRLFRSRFQLELSETALGHCRISDLLQDTLFQDICTLQLRGNSYVVVQSGHPVSEASDASASSDEVACEQEAQSSQDTEEHSSLWKSLAARTFIHLPRTPMTPVRRSSSVPRDQGSSKNSDTSTKSSMSMSPSDEISTEASDTETLSPERLRFCPDEPLWLEDSSSLEVEMPTLGLPLVTPSPQYGMLGCGVQAAQRVKFCEDAPLSLEDAFAAESEMAAFALVTPSPLYEAPQHFPTIIPPAPQHAPMLSTSVEPRTFGSMPAPVYTPKLSTTPEVVSRSPMPPPPPQHTPKLSTSPAQGEGLSLFQKLGFAEMSAGIDAVAEEPGSSEGLKGERRVPLCSEPLSLDEEEHPESEAWTALPLMTPSPQYHAATYLRHAALRNVQKSPAASPLTRQLRNGLGSQPAYLGRVSSFPCATPSPQYPSVKLGHLPRLLEAGA